MVSLPSGLAVRHSWSSIRSGRPRRPQCRQVTSPGGWLVGCSTDSFDANSEFFMLRVVRSTEVGAATPASFYEAVRASQLYVGWLAVYTLLLVKPF